MRATRLFLSFIVALLTLSSCYKESVPPPVYVPDDELSLGVNPLILESYATGSRVVLSGAYSKGFEIRRGEDSSFLTNVSLNKVYKEGTYSITVTMRPNEGPERSCTLTITNGKSSIDLVVIQKGAAE